MRFLSSVERDVRSRGDHPDGYLKHLEPLMRCCAIVASGRAWRDPVGHLAPTVRAGKFWPIPGEAVLSAGVSGRLYRLSMARFMMGRRHHTQEGFMGFSASDPARGQRSQLNVTPLVDVVLVLLIIFLVASPLSVAYLPVDLPQDAPEPSVEAIPGLKVIMRSNERIVIDDGVHGRTEVDRFALASTLRPRLEARHMDRTVFVEFEDEVAYGDAVGLMDTIKGVGADTIALATRR